MHLLTSSELQGDPGVYASRQSWHTHWRGCQSMFISKTKILFRPTSCGLCECDSLYWTGWLTQNFGLDFFSFLNLNFPPLSPSQDTYCTCTSSQSWALVNLHSPLSLSQCFPTWSAGTHSRSMFSLPTLDCVWATEDHIGTHWPICMHLECERKPTSYEENRNDLKWLRGSALWPDLHGLEEAPGLSRPSTEKPLWMMLWIMETTLSLWTEVYIL